MADQIELLKQLQALDSQLYQLRRQQAEKPKILERIQTEVAAQEDQLKAVEQRLKSLQMAQKEKEVELQTREANIKKLQGQLFQVKTNKEYSALQHEIALIKADNSVLEEGILKAFDEIDAVVKDRQTEQARVAQQQERLRMERQRIDQALAAIAEQVAQLERDRKLLAPEIPPATLTAYERVLIIRDGVAMVAVLNDACGGCYRRLPPQVINEILLKAKLVTCESCNRILYFDEAQSKL